MPTSALRTCDRLLWPMIHRDDEMKKTIRKVKKEEDFADGDIRSQSEQSSMELLDSLDQTEREMESLYTKLTASTDPERYADEVGATIRSCKRTTANIRKAYQRSAAVGDELSARWSDLTKGKGRKLIPAAPANAVIDMEESRLDHFARGLNGYKLMLVCFIGSFAGVIIEMLWCLLTRGYIESRAGLVYGPFNMLYGVGAVVMTVALYRFRNKGKWISFLGGLVVGSVVEYFCSWGQELLLGSTSWDYSRMPFNLNGRICLLYSIFWGILGVLWMKTLYPWMAKLILKLPDRGGKALTWAVTAFLVFDCVVTVIAVSRWAQRVDMIGPSNAFWECIDVWFPDDRMERIFANMVFG